MRRELAKYTAQIISHALDRKVQEEHADNTSTLTYVSPRGVTTEYKAAYRMTAAVISSPFRDYLPSGCSDRKLNLFCIIGKKNTDHLFFV